MKRRIQVVLFLILLINNKSFSQTGPGGIGTNDGTSNLIIWYRPDSGILTTGILIDSWQNSAGVAAFNLLEAGSQRPTLVNNAINGYNEGSFSGSNRLRTGLTLNSSNFIINQATSFLVTKADNITQQSSVYTTDPLVNSTRFSNHIPWNRTVYYDIGACCNTSSRLQVGNLTGLTDYSIFTYNANPTTGKQLYRNQSLLQNRPNTSTYNSYANRRFNVGGNTAGSKGFQGDVTELIIYKTTRNTAERIIIDNYLAAKFNQNLNNNDFYNEDDSGSGDFDHKVAGIGQATDGSNHIDSQGTGIVRINTPSNLQDNEYLFWGENEKDANYTFSAVVPVNKRHRINTKWRVSEMGDVGTVNFSVNATDIDITGAPVGILKLVRSTTSDFSTTVEEYNLTLSGGVYSATGVSFDDNDYFTLEIVPTSDLSLTKTVDTALPKVGSVIKFTLSITNNGPQDATNVIVKDKFPTNLQYNSAESDISTGMYNAGSGEWTVGVIAKDQTISIQIAATINSVGIITNTAEVLSLDQEEPDSVPNSKN